MSEEPFFSTAQAVGKGLDFMTSEERAKSLSKITDNRTRGQLQLAFSAGELFPFLTTHADVTLLLLISDKNALGRSSMTRILEAQVSADRLSMKDRLLGFIGRGEGG